MAAPARWGGIGAGRGAAVKRRAFIGATLPATFAASVLAGLSRAARALSPPEPESITSVPWLRPLEAPVLLNKFGGSVGAVAFSADGQRLLAETDKTVFSLDAASGKALGEPAASPRGLGERGAFLPGGRQLVIATWVSTVSTENGRRVASQAGEVLRAEVGGPNVNIKRQALLALRQQVTALGVSGDGKLIALGLADGTVQVLDAGSGASLLGPVPGYAGIKLGPTRLADVTAIAFSADAARIAFVGVDAALRFLDAHSGKALGAPLAPAVTGATSLIESLLFTPDGKRLIAASQDKGLYLLDAMTGKPLGPRLQMDNKATALALSPDGLRLVIGGFSGEVRRWELA